MTRRYADRLQGWILANRPRSASRLLSPAGVLPGSCGRVRDVGPAVTSQLSVHDQHAAHTARRCRIESVVVLRQNPCRRQTVCEPADIIAGANCDALLETCNLSLWGSHEANSNSVGAKSQALMQVLSLTKLSPYRLPTIVGAVRQSDRIYPNSKRRGQPMKARAMTREFAQKGHRL